MNLKQKLIFSLVGILLTTSCVGLNTVSLTSIPAQRTHQVRAEASRFMFFAFNFDNDYVNNMVSDLRDQCPNGVVSGVLTKDEAINYFLYIFWTRKVTATGYCVKGKVDNVSLR